MDKRTAKQLACRIASHLLDDFRTGGDVDTYARTERDAKRIGDALDELSQEMFNRSSTTKLEQYRDT